MDGAVEECLRWVTPIQLFCRTATTDARIGDVDIPAGDRVVLLYASANRDEAAFGDDADRFDVTRPPNPAHLAFGFGEHLCLGASLARLEGRIVLRQLLDRFGAYEVTGEPTWGRSTLVRGMASLPVLLG
ncbi:MAG: cytochrome P450 [Acidimicrobiales bacterium]